MSSVGQTAAEETYAWEHLTHVYIHAYVHAYAHIYVHVYTHMSTHMFICVPTHVSTHMSAHRVCAELLDGSRGAIESTHTAVWPDAAASRTQTWLTLTTVTTK